MEPMAAEIDSDAGIVEAAGVAAGHRLLLEDRDPGLPLSAELVGRAEAGGAGAEDRDVRQGIGHEATEGADGAVTRTGRWRIRLSMSQVRPPSRPPAISTVCHKSEQTIATPGATPNGRRMVARLASRTARPPRLIGNKLATLASGQAKNHTASPTSMPSWRPSHAFSSTKEP